MEDPLGPLERASERVFVAQIADDHLELGARREVRGIAAEPRHQGVEDRDPRAVIEQGAGDVAPEEAEPPGDQNAPAAIGGQRAHLASLDAALVVPTMRLTTNAGAPAVRWTR